MENSPVQQQKPSRWRRFLLYLLSVLLTFGLIGLIAYAQTQHYQRNDALVKAIREVKNRLSREEARPGTPRADALIKRVTQLLDQGADPNVRDEIAQPSGWWGTLLSRLMPPRPPEEEECTGLAVISMLPRHWHNVTFASPPDKNGHVMMSLGLVISEDDKLVTILFRKLLDKGANVNTRDYDDGQSLLAKTLSDGYWDCAEMLIKRGAKVNIPNEEGLTPLHETARIGNPRILKILIYAGADIHARDKEGETSLHYAVSYNNVDCARLLVDAGADINARSKTGSTPLISAVNNSVNRETLRYLLNQKADINAIDNSGKTALAHANSRGDREVSKLLREAGQSKTQILP